MQTLRPESAAELAEALASAASAKRTITLGGGFSKNCMAGGAQPSDVVISTSAMTRVLEYEPRDLTISVEAGMPYAELTRLLAANRQMIPLDPIFADRATVGGVVASNCNGPRRRLYGTARDLVIGMKFATLAGKLPQTGGMVVKNVAGLDMGKLLIGSFGTLAAIAVLNFKLQPLPACSRTFVFSYDTLQAALQVRDAFLRGILQPSALDLMNPAASRRIGRDGYVLLVQAAGNEAVVERYAREFREAESMSGKAEQQFWESIREFTPGVLSEYPNGVMVRVATPLTQVHKALEAAGGPAIARAGSGICYACYAAAAEAQTFVKSALAAGWRAVIDVALGAGRGNLDLWPNPGSDFEMMKRIKEMFDPGYLLNKGRLYGRI